MKDEKKLEYESARTPPILEIGVTHAERRCQEDGKLVKKLNALENALIS